MSAAVGAEQVRAAIRAEDRGLVAARPWLGRDDAVAFGGFLAALVLWALLAVGWLTGGLPAWVAVVGIALAASVLHELEHDLIHDLYLAHPVVRTLVLLVIWLGKGSLDPWSRGHMHRWHHIVSGQDDDLEERLIGLGLRWGALRLAMTLWPPVGLVLHPRLKRAVRAKLAAGGRGPDPRAYRFAPHLLLGNTVLFLLPVVALVAWLQGASWALSLLVLWVLPNTLRHGCIATLSANSHYVEIRRGAVVEQNQVLDHPLFWPLQLFSWNFGATHVVHHFVVRQPFWRRTLVFPRVRQVLLDAGVPANDLGTFRRANRRLPARARPPITASG